jgi:hypothetical protein
MAIDIYQICTFLENSPVPPNQQRWQPPQDTTYDHMGKLI